MSWLRLLVVIAIVKIAQLFYGIAYTHISEIKQMFISEIGLYIDYDWTLCGHTQAPTSNWFGLVCSHCPSRTWHSKRRFEGYVWVCWWMMRYSFEFYNDITSMKEITRQVLLYTDCDWTSSQIYRLLTLSASGSFDPIGLWEHTWMLVETISKVCEFIVDPLSGSLFFLLSCWKMSHLELFSVYELW